MAMNKKETAELEQALIDRDMALALRFRSEPLPEPMKPDEDYRKILRGWSKNTYNRTVSAGCFTRQSHAIGYTHSTSSQGSGTFYATRLEALLVLRHELTVQYAAYLAIVDRAIEKERAEPTPIPDTSKGRSNA